MTPTFAWDAPTFFRQLTTENRLAQSHGFVYCRVSGLDGFEEALARMQSALAFVAVSDISQGSMQLHNTPQTRRVHTVFLAMRHAIDDMEARQSALNTLRELFRQFMTRLLPERTRLEMHGIYLDPRIAFAEIDRYFFSGCACAHFAVAVNTFTSLAYEPDLWTIQP